MALFHGFESFIRMGGYGSYVWPAVSITVILLLGNAIFLASQLRRLLKKQGNRTESMTHESTA